MKSCTRCKITKPFSEFGRDKHKKLGLTSRCKDCMAELARQSRANDPERARQITKRYRQKNLEKERARYTRYNKSKPEVRAFHSAKRRASQKQATPSWLTEEHYSQIKGMYDLARECEILTGDKYHVDHIVPLAGEAISGLHVPWNLQVLPAEINIAKSNSYGEDTF